jgi:hypothetical protein
MPRCKNSSNVPLGRSSAADRRPPTQPDDATRNRSARQDVQPLSYESPLSSSSHVACVGLQPTSGRVISADAGPSIDQKPPRNSGQRPISGSTEIGGTSSPWAIASATRRIGIPYLGEAEQRGGAVAVDGRPPVDPVADAAAFLAAATAVAVNSMSPTPWVADGSRTTPSAMVSPLGAGVPILRQGADDRGRSAVSSRPHPC